MRLVLFTFFILSSSLLFSQEERTALVKSIDGIDVYIFSTPTSKYEEVYTVSSVFGYANPLQLEVELFVGKVRKKNKKREKKGLSVANAIIINSGDKASAITYK